MRFDFSKIGRWTSDSLFEVKAEQTIAWAAATNESRRGALTGSEVPPIFAVIPALVGPMTKAMRSVAVSERQGYDTRFLHGEQDLFIYAPIRPGMRLQSRGATVGVHPKRSGTIITMRTETRTGAGELLNHQYFTSFIREVVVDRAVGETPPSRDIPESPDRDRPLGQVLTHVDKDQSRRYAEASGDYGTYHIDEAAARKAGFPGLILHGLCTMALAARSVATVVSRDQPDRIRRFAVRFAKPVFLDQDLTTTVWAAGRVADERVVVFETRDQKGDLVISRGIAHVHD